MAYKTMQQLITDVQHALYQAAGSNVQVYSQDVLMGTIQDAFDHLFSSEWWPHFRVREEKELNGTTGHFTTPLQYIKQYDDVRFVFNRDSARPLPVMPLGVNPYGSYFVEGSTPRFVEGDAVHIIRVYPTTAVGEVTVVGRARPEPYLLDDVVQMDATLLKHYAAWSYLVDDGSNPDAANKQKVLFEARLRQLRNNSFQEPIALDPWVDAIPNQWTEGRPY